MYLSTVRMRKEMSSCSQNLTSMTSEYDSKPHANSFPNCYIKIILTPYALYKACSTTTFIWLKNNLVHRDQLTSK